MKLSDLPKGTRVVAHNEKRGGMYSGEIEDNLSVMYYIHFDCGAKCFVYKASRIELEKTNDGHTTD